MAQHVGSEVRGGGKARGREATRPREIPLAGWRDIALRVKDNVSEHNISIMAAGVAFYALLAIFPALALIVSIYGLVADPSQVSQQLTAFQGALPEDVRSVLASQMNAVASRSGAALSVGAIVALVIALWSASAAVRILMTALNVIYQERETRGFIHFFGLALLLTLCAVLLAVLAIGLIVALPTVLAFLPLPGWLQALTYILPWIVLVVVVAAALNGLYRYGSSRAIARWRWVSWGAVTATVLWLIGSGLFSVYISYFGSYGEVYGSFAAIVILLMWFFLTAFAVLLGAEINAEMEHQTERDTTAGHYKPLGERGAHVADTVGRER